MPGDVSGRLLFTDMIGSCMNTCGMLILSCQMFSLSLLLVMVSAD